MPKELNLAIAKDARAEATIEQLLGDMNLLRKASGREPLQSWSANKERLIEKMGEIEEKLLSPANETADTQTGDASKGDAKSNETKAKSAKGKLDKAAKETKVKAAKADKEPRFFPKGVFKSKAPIMKDERGKVWEKLQAKLSDGSVVDAHFEKNKGSYFYLTFKDVCYSGKMDDFPVKNGKTKSDPRVLDLSSVA